MLNNNYQKILIKFGIWLGLGIAIMITGISNVFAEQINVGYVTDKTQVLIEASAVQSQPVTLPAGTQNSYGNIYQMYFNIDNIEIKANMLYQLEIYTPGPKLTNINQIYVNGNRTQVCQVLGLVGLNGNYPKLFFKCQSNATSIVASFGTTSTDTITTAQNWYWSYTYLRYFTDDNDIDLGPVISNATNNTNNIINNNNQNTQDIINNQNNNNQAVIDNDNANTNKIIENNQVCDTVDKNDKAYDGYLYDNGQIGTNLQNMIVTDYFSVDENTKITKLENTLTNGAYRICFYDDNYSFVSCMAWQQYYDLDEIPVPDNASYVRFTINTENDVPKFKICKNGNQAVADNLKEQNKTSKGILGKIGELFDNLFSNEDADISGLNNMVGWLPPGPVDSIINLPLALFNSLTNTLSGTCQDVTLTLPFVNQTLTLPCFDRYMQKYLTNFSTFWSLVGFIVSVFILYNYLLALYKWVDDTLTFRENNMPGYYGDNWGGGA